MLNLRHLEPKVIENAQVTLKVLYYTDTISVSVSLDVKKDTSLAHRDDVLFCFVLQDKVQQVTIPVVDLVQYEEIWLPRPQAKFEVYTNDAFDLYSYTFAKPFWAKA